MNKLKLYSPGNEFNDLIELFSFSETRVKKMKGSLRWNDAWFLLYTVVIPFSQGLRTMSSNILFSSNILHSIPLSSFLLGINNLEGKAGFRKASLHWKYLSPEEKASVTFRIRYCELHAWGLHRCRYQVLISRLLEQKYHT